MGRSLLKWQWLSRREEVQRAKGRERRSNQSKARPVREVNLPRREVMTRSHKRRVERKL
jgi:hypothetical protein